MPQIAIRVSGKQIPVYLVDGDDYSTALKFCVERLPLEADRIAGRTQLCPLIQNGYTASVRLQPNTAAAKIAPAPSTLDSRLLRKFGFQKSR